MKIAVIGTGYVGLVSGVCFADLGHDVTCIDVLPEKVKMINRGETPIFEEGLTELLQKHLEEGNFRATLDYDDAKDAEAIFIAVQTPSAPDGSMDMQFVCACAKSIGELLKNVESTPTVIVKSTVVPGTTEGDVRRILEETSGKQAGEGFSLGMNPEFLREGKAVFDFKTPDRIVMGGIDKRSIEVQRALYDGIQSTVFETTPTTAEMIKYGSNSLLAVKISFINEIANVCEKMGIDVTDVAHGIGLDSRIAPSFLNAGIGFGGSCFPKDVKALVAVGKSLQVQLNTLEAALTTNRSQPLWAVEALKKHLGSLKGKQVAVWGMAFKPGTDDMREAPAIPIIQALVSEGAIIKAYDPVARHTAEAVFKDTIEYGTDKLSILDGADALVTVTEWNEFRETDLSEVKKRMAAPIIVDGRRVFKTSDLMDHGFRHSVIGWSRKD